MGCSDEETTNSSAVEHSAVCSDATSYTSRCFPGTATWNGGLVCNGPVVASSARLAENAQRPTPNGQEAIEALRIIVARRQRRMRDFRKA